MHLQLKQILKEKNITQKELAKKLNFSQQNITSYITGRTEPSIEVILKICVILNTDPNTLLGYNKKQDSVEDLLNDLSSSVNKIKKILNS